MVASAGLTRGALYHHFSDKKELFEEAFKQVSEDVQKRIDAEALAQSGSRWEKTLAAFKAHLRIRADDPEAQRILMVDGPAVLGWERWRYFQTDLMNNLTRVLAELMDINLIIRLPSRQLAGQLIASLNDAASCIAHSPTPRDELAQQIEVICAIFEGLRPRV